MNRFIILFLTLLLQGVAAAQNWQTVLPNDTTYYTTDRPDITNSNARLIRVAWIDSALTAPAGNEYSFYKTIRESNTALCLDLAAPSWLGSRYIRKADGAEYYFNGKGDTLKFLTMAATGAQWNIISTASGLTVKATVTTSGTMQVDGVTDSFKTIAMQAFQNNIPAISWCNAIVLQISKQHGWLKTMDMYTFPNVPATLYLTGTIRDTTQHVRLPKSFNSTHFDAVNNNRYVAGNEWTYCHYGYTWPLNDALFTHDSIISVQPITGGAATVILHRDTYTIWTALVSGNLVYMDSSHSATDTIVINQPSTSPVLNTKLQPDAQPVSGLRTDLWNYYLDSACGQPVIKMICSNVVVPIQTNPGCYHAASIYDYEDSSREYLANFGYIDYTFTVYRGHPTIREYKEDRYTYIKTATCTYGTKVSLVSLGIKKVGPVIKNLAFSVAPNPASNIVTINTGNTLTGSLIITDLAGRSMYRQPLSGNSMTIPVQDYAAGIYIIQLTTSDGANASQKLVIVK